jgi:hypothetical protein
MVLDAESAAVPPEWRDIASARSLRIEILAAGAGVRLLGLAERKVDVVDLVGEDVGVAVLVLSDPQSALLFRIPGTLRFDNLIVHGAGRPAVRAALDDLD